MFRSMRTALVVAASAILLAGCSSSGDVSTYIDGWADSTPVPSPSAAGLVSNSDEAYEFGAEVAAGLPVAGNRFGYKFGCGAAVCPFAEHIPLVGTLWQGMVQPAGSVVDTSAYVRGFVEGELAFKLSQDVTEPVTAEQLRSIASEVAPAVELPDFLFGDSPIDETPIIDVIAANAIARGVVLGDFVPTSSVDVDSVELRGTRDGVEVLTGGTADVTLKSHWEALALAITLLLENGREVRAGDTILTGTMGEPTPLENGEYELTYGPLGSLTFTGAGS